MCIIYADDVPARTKTQNAQPESENPKILIKYQNA